MFIDYSYYISEYGGRDLNEDEFNKSAFKSCSYISANTMDRVNDYKITTLPEKLVTQIKKCACALTEYFDKFSKILDNSFKIASGEIKGNIKSEQAGQVSISYGDNGSITKEYLNPNYRDLILKSVLNEYLYPMEINGTIWNLTSKVLNSNRCIHCNLI